MLGLSAPLPVRKIQYKAGDNNALNSDLALIDEDLQHLKMNIPRMVSRDEIVNEVFNPNAAQTKIEMQM